jgi:hypothetical protein
MENDQQGLLPFFLPLSILALIFGDASPTTNVRKFA